MKIWTGKDISNLASNSLGTENKWQENYFNRKFVELKALKEILVDAYCILFNNKNKMNISNEFEERMNQRIDEIIILYSTIFNITFIESKDSLEKERIEKFDEENEE